MQSEARAILERATKLEVTTDSGMLDANQFIVDLAPAIKKATQYKDALTKETKGVLKDVDAVCKSVIDALEGANDTVRRKVIQYRREQEEAQREVQRILEQQQREQEEEARKNNLPPPVITPSVISPPTPSESKTIRVDGGQISYSKKWTFTITDIDKVPEEIVRAAVKTSRGRDALESIIRQRVEGGIRKIEGVVIEETEQSTVRK